MLISKSLSIEYYLIYMHLENKTFFLMLCLFVYNPDVFFLKFLNEIFLLINVMFDFFFPFH